MRRSTQRFYSFFFRRPSGLPFALLLCLISAYPLEAKRGNPPAKNDSPEGTLWRFDSLLDVGANSAARDLTTGGAARMFDLIVLSQAQLKPVIDTNRSRDTILTRVENDSAAALKVFGLIYFSHPFMGMDSLASTQAIHFLRVHKRWRLSDFEELPNPQSVLLIRSAASGGATAAKPPSPTPLPSQAAAAVSTPGLFPLSPRTVAEGTVPDTLRFRLSLRNGDSLAPLCVRDEIQALVRAESRSALTLEARRPQLPTSPLASHDLLSPSFDPYLTSTPYLDLSDTALTHAAQALGAGRLAPLAYTQAVYQEVIRTFRFALGASLFGNSREVLRKRQGDCSEAAVLVAALLRAGGIPSRIVLGFASTGGGAFIGHAWTEAYLGKWIGVDAALREYPAGVMRLRLATLDGQGDLRVTATNLMLKVLNNLDVEILAASTRRHPLKLIASSADPASGQRFFEAVLRGAGSAPQ